MSTLRWSDEAEDASLHGMTFSSDGADGNAMKSPGISSVNREEMEDERHVAEGASSIRYLRFALKYW